MKKLLCAVAASLALSGCIVEQNDAVRSLSYQEAIKQIPVGSSKDTVLKVLGKPFTVNSFNGEERWSYVDQRVDLGKVLTPFKPAIHGLDTKAYNVQFDIRGRVKMVTQSTFNL